MADAQIFSNRFDLSGCRDAVNSVLGAMRTNNKAFWAKY
jgi:hypothetical protein